MNPFDLPGPSFLLFYLVLAGAVLWAVMAAIRKAESGQVPALSQIDPYLVASLRGGSNEALRVVVMSLIDRKLLTVDGEKLAADKGTLLQVRRPIEREVLRKFTVPGPALEIFASDRAREAATALDQDLRQLRLLPNARDVTRRRLAGTLAVAVLWIVAAEKIALAIERGHHNIGFLIALALLAAIVVIAALARRRTTIGQRFMSDLRELFGGLQGRAAQIPAGGATNELALLMGVFGLGVMTGESADLASRLFPRTTGAGVSSGSSGCGSSCGSGGSSCGGGCGGGGCGGCGG